MHNMLNHKGVYSLVPRSLGIWGIQYSISKYSCSPSEVYREHWMICTLIIKYWLLSTTQYMQYAFFSSIHVIITVTSCLVPQSTLSWSIFSYKCPTFTASTWCFTPGFEYTTLHSLLNWWVTKVVGYMHTCSIKLGIQYEGLIRHVVNNHCVDIV